MSKSSDEKTVITCIGAVVVFLAIFVGSVLLNGMVLTMLWEWFIVPLGLPAITLVHAIGIATVIGMLRQVRQQKKDDKASWGDSLITLLSPVFLLGFGYLVQLFM